MLAIWFSRPILTSLLATLIFYSDAVKASGEAGLTRDNYCGKNYCVTATYSPTAQNINYTLAVVNSGPSSGWYSIGQGDKMSGANMIIGWVNSDSSVTTSQRSASGHHQPLASQFSAAAYTVDTVNTKLINNTILSLSWTLPQTTSPDNAMAHMFAYSTRGPSSSQSDASIAMHNSFNRFNLDMTKAYTNASSSSSASPTGSTSISSQTSSDSSSGPLLPSDNSSSSNNGTSANIFVAHVVFMIIAWMLLAPFGALIARYGRNLFTWFPAHRAIQMGTVLFMIVGFALGVAGLTAEGSPHLTETHHRVGVLILVLVLVQVGLGYWAHSYRAKKAKRHVGWVHMPLGVLLFGLGVWNTQSGFELWSVQPSFKVNYIIYGWAALMTLLYVGGLFLLPREMKQAKQAKRMSQSQEALSLERMQRREVDGLMPVHDYNRYQHMNSSEANFNREGTFDQEATFEYDATFDHEANFDHRANVDHRADYNQRANL